MYNYGLNIPGVEANNSEAGWSEAAAGGDS